MLGAADCVTDDRPDQRKHGAVVVDDPAFAVPVDPSPPCRNEAMVAAVQPNKGERNGILRRRSTGNDAHIFRSKFHALLKADDDAVGGHVRRAGITLYCAASARSTTI